VLWQLNTPEAKAALRRASSSFPDVSIRRDAESHSERWEEER
jgi:hypothetical protein